MPQKAQAVNVHIFVACACRVESLHPSLLYKTARLLWKYKAISTNVFSALLVTSCGSSGEWDGRLQALRFLMETQRILNAPALLDDASTIVRISDVRRGP